MSFRRWGYYIGQGFRSIGRNKIMSFSTILTVAISLFAMGAFLVAMLSINNFIAAQSNKTQLAVYVDPEYTEEQVQSVQDNIERINGIAEIQYISKEEGMEIFKNKFGDDQNWKDVFGDENPLPYTFNITAENAENLDSIKAQAEGITGVYLVEYPEALVSQLVSAMNTFRIVGLIVVVILFLSATFLISTTIKLSVYAKRKELMVMKYVGSSNGFIQGPFLFSGMLLGFLGALVASGCLFGVYKLVMDKWASSITFLHLSFNWTEIGVIMGILFVSGLVIGFIGSFIATRKYIKV